MMLSEYNVLTDAMNTNPQFEHKSGLALEQSFMPQCLVVSWYCSCNDVHLFLYGLVKEGLIFKDHT